MTQSFHFGEKEFISSKEAALTTGYASDYIGQLCRGGKVESRMVGRTWFVSKESILKHKESNLIQNTSKVFQFISDTSLSSQKFPEKFLSSPVSSPPLNENFLPSFSRDTLVLQNEKGVISTGEFSDY